MASNELNNAEAVLAGRREDARLLAECRAGSQDAFRRLIERYQDMVVNLAARMTGSLEDAEDIAQEVFLKACQGLAEFKGESSLKTWLYRITANAAISHGRRKQARPRTVSLDDGGNGHGGLEPAGGEGPAAGVEVRERERLVQNAILALEADLRAVVLLRDMEGYRYEAIAETLGVEVGTVKSRLFRARESLRKALAGKIGSF
ncbi:MAG: sigma-70 family RNA polymerase sigma factor [Planctomycetota bacterium]